MTRPSGRIAAVLAATGLLVAMLGSAANAETSEGAAPRGEPLVQEGGEVVASGLDNPRHVAVDRRGRVWVAEAGRGGPVLVDIPLGASDGPQCVGTTGALSVITPQGQQVRAITGLPSVAESVDGSCDDPGVGFFSTGPHGIDLSGSRLVGTGGLGGTPDDRVVLAAAVEEAGFLGSVGGLPPTAPPFDLAQFEVDVDANGDGADSNPYGVLARPQDGTVVVADSGANTVTEIDRDGQADVVAVFAPRCVPWLLPFPNPIPPEFNPCGTQDEFPAQAVPTGVAEAADGDLLVSTLGGFPFTPGFSQIYKIDADHEGTASCSSFAFVPADGCEVFADGLTSVVDVATGDDGTVYAVELSRDGVGALEGGAPGSDIGSVQILHGGTGAVIGSIEGLTLPGGVAVDGDRVYVSTMSVFVGAGEVIEARAVCSTGAGGGTWCPSAD